MRNKLQLTRLALHLRRLLSKRAILWVMSQTFCLLIIQVCVCECVGIRVYVNVCVCIQVYQYVPYHTRVCSLTFMNDMQEQLKDVDALVQYTTVSTSFGMPTSLIHLCLFSFWNIRNVDSSI